MPFDDPAINGVLIVGNVPPDLSVPGAPSNLTAIAGDGQVLLGWSDNPESDIRRYNVYMSLSSGGPWEFLGSTNVSEFVVTGLDNGTAHYFYVTAVDSASNESAPSAEVNATPTAPGGGDVTPPAVPTGLTATAGDKQIVLDWSDVGDSDFNHYRIYRGTATGGPYTQIATRTVSNYTDTGLTNGTQYFYVVSAVDLTGNESAQSSEDDATPTAGAADTTPPLTPTGLSATPGDRQVALNWNNNVEADLASYKVFRALVGGSFVHIATRLTSDFLNGSLTNGTQYFYRVSALDTSNNESPLSPVVSATPVAPPAPPGGGYGPRVAVGPKSISQPGGSVTINVGDNWQSKVNANPINTVFWCKAGVHNAQSVLAKNGNQFVGELGCIMDGNNSVKYAFDSTGGGQVGITIKNIEIRDYIPDLQTGAAGHWGNGSSWTIQDCEIYNNAGAAIRLNPGMQVKACNLHHNAQYGLAGGGGSGIIIEDCEIAFNNTAFYDRADQGGSKFWNTNGLIVRYCWFHHNLGKGTGWWADIDNINVLVHNTRSSDNGNHGFFQEIGYECVMRDNIAERNLGSGFRNVNSRGVEIYDNECIDNSDGITSAVDTGRAGPGRFGAWEVKDQSIHDNYIEMGPKADTGVFTDGHASCLHDPSGVAYGAARNNDWDFNTYHTSTARALQWSWQGGNRTFSQWQGFGHDLNGSVV